MDVRRRQHASDQGADVNPLDATPAQAVRQGQGPDGDEHLDGPRGIA